MIPTVPNASNFNQARRAGLRRFYFCSPSHYGKGLGRAIISKLAVRMKTTMEEKPVLYEKHDRVAKV
ncbi:MAG: hypothetical protein WAU82_25205, partial [Candidatus Binatus sp.]|uniref:hypothetical protein n=1 Tax=Candidatus Binatus sp. TaxID=2811406 RepID=UPI003BAFDEB9